MNIVRLLLARNDIDINGNRFPFWSPLHHSASSGYLEMVELLLSQDNVDVNGTNQYSSETPLHEAAFYGHLEIVEMLLRHKSIDYHSRNRHGALPLHVAAAKGHWKIVRVLLSEENLPEVSESDSNQAQEQEKTETSDLLGRLLSHPECRDVNSPKYNGQTLLHCSIMNQDCNLTKLMLAHKDIIVNRLNWFGQTPLQLTVRYSNIEAARLLLQHKDIDEKARQSWINSWSSSEIAKLYYMGDIVDLIPSRDAIHGTIDSTTTVKNTYNISAPSDTRDKTQVDIELEPQSHSLFDEYIEDLEMNDSSSSEEDSMVDVMDYSSTI